MLSLANSTRPFVSASSCARMGSTALHGPHQGAQKSSTTGTSAVSTSRSNVSSVTSNIPFHANRAALYGRYVRILAVLAVSLVALVFAGAVEADRNGSRAALSYWAMKHYFL